MLAPSTFRKIVLGSAVYDLLVTAPFTTLLGSVVLLWALLRISDPQRRFSTWMVWALAATGEPLLWLFIVPALAFGVAQWLPVRRL